MKPTSLTNPNAKQTWFEDISIAIAQAFTGIELIFLQHDKDGSKSVYCRRAPGKKHTTIELDGSLTHNDKRLTCFVYWLNRSHFELLMLKNRDGTYQTLFEEGDPIVSAAYANMVCTRGSSKAPLTDPAQFQFSSE